MAFARVAPDNAAQRRVGLQRCRCGLRPGQRKRCGVGVIFDHHESTTNLPDPRAVSVNKPDTPAGNRC
jgi:hypothetical protein